MNRSHVSNTSSFWRFAYQKPTISFGCRDDDDNDDVCDDAGHFVVCCSLHLHFHPPLTVNSFMASSITSSRWDAIESANWLLPELPARHNSLYISAAMYYFIYIFDNRTTNLMRQRGKEKQNRKRTQTCRAVSGNSRCAQIPRPPHRPSVSMTISAPFPLTQSKEQHFAINMVIPPHTPDESSLISLICN